MQPYFSDNSPAGPVAVDDNGTSGVQDQAARITAEDDGIIKYGEEPQSPPSPTQPVQEPDPAPTPASDPDPAEPTSLRRKPPSKGLSRQLAKSLEKVTDEELLVEAGIIPVYSTSDVADFFNRSPQWVYFGMRPNKRTGEIIFVWEDGTPINPERLGDPEKGRRRWTLPIIQRILQVMYRRGNVKPDELKLILRRIYIDQHGGDYREVEKWPKNPKGKYINPYRLDDDDEIKGIEPDEEPDHDAEEAPAAEIES